MIARGAKDEDDEDLPPDLVRRLPRPRQARAVTRRCDRRRRRRGRDRRRPGAGRNDRRAVDRQPDQEGARQQGHEGARPARRFARRQRVRLRAGAARARADARRRQAGRRLDGQRRRLGRLLDLDRVRRDRRRRRRRSPARSACSRCCRRADKTLDKLGVHADGVATTWLRNAGDPRLPLDPRFAALVQTSIDHIYLDFTTKVAAARKTTPEKIDAVAQGRVWTGAQAKERGLVDTVGSFGDALDSAATRAKLGDRLRVVYIERDAGQVRAARRRCSTRSVARLIGAADRRCASAPRRRCRRSSRATLARDLGWLAEIAERSGRSRRSSTVSARDLR